MIIIAEFNIKYSKVWKIEEVNGLIKVNLGDSKKNKEGNYDNCTWFGCLIVGNAKSVELKEGDIVNAHGQIFQNKVGDKYYTNVVIFEICLSENSKSKSKSNKVKMKDVDANLPKSEENPNDINFDDLEDDFPF